MLKGIDVSYHQGNIDWSKVKAAGIEFAIIKAGGSDDGFYTDSKWEANYKGAKAAGIKVGAYYFVGKNCTNASAGKADAERFLLQLKDKQLEYPVYMDNEAQPASAKAGITEATIAFCEKMESAGYFVGVYGSSDSGFRERMDDSKLTSYAHWVAQYASKCTYKGSYGIWQYSSTGSIPGINTNVDLNYCYIDYPSAIKKAGLNGFSGKILDEKGYKKGDKNALAYKEMLRLAIKKKIISGSVDRNGTFGKGTEAATNALLKKWGYTQNGIAGDNLIKRLGDLL